MNRLNGHDVGMANALPAATLLHIVLFAIVLTALGAAGIGGLFGPDTLTRIFGIIVVCLGVALAILAALRFRRR